MHKSISKANINLSDNVNCHLQNIDNTSVEKYLVCMYNIDTDGMTLTE